MATLKKTQAQKALKAMIEAHNLRCMWCGRYVLPDDSPQWALNCVVCSDLCAGALKKDPYFKRWYKMNK